MATNTNPTRSSPWPNLDHLIETETAITSVLRNFEASIARFDIEPYKGDWARVFARSINALAKLKTNSIRSLKIKSTIAIMGAWAFHFTLPPSLVLSFPLVLALIVEALIVLYAIWDMIRQFNHVTRYRKLAEKLNSAATHLTVVSNLAYLRGRAVRWNFD